jgi:hypothetical protein
VHCQGEALTLLVWAYPRQSWGILFRSAANGQEGTFGPDGRTGRQRRQRRGQTFPLFLGVRAQQLRLHSGLDTDRSVDGARDGGLDAVLDEVEQGTGWAGCLIPEAGGPACTTSVVGIPQAVSRSVAEASSAGLAARRRDLTVGSRFDAWKGDDDLLVANPFSRRPGWVW